MSPRTIAPAPPCRGSRPQPPPARLARLALAAAALLGASCERGAGDKAAGGAGGSSSSAAASTVRFSDATERSGLRFLTVCGGKDKDWILEVNGAGVALLDYDGDGDLDVFLVNGSRLPPPYGEGAGDPPPADALFKNLGGLRFEDVTRAAGLAEGAWGCGAAAGDYDNDGDADVFVANYGPDILWRNNGDGTFSDVTAAAGVGDPEWGASCAFLDYDRDGWLDIFVVNYLVFDPQAVKRRGSDPTCRYKGQPILCGPVGLPPAPCTLYRNRGDGSFEDVSKSSGIRAVEPSYGLGVCVLDADGDGWLDIYVANDTRANLLFRNRGDGGFDEIGMLSGAALNDQAVAQASMGVDAPFLGERPLEDLFVTVYEDDANTYRRNDGGFFTEMSSPMGLAEPCFKYLGWGTFFFDADLDGDLDLYVAQGHVVPQSDSTASSPGYAQLNKLFLNDGSGKFHDASARAGPGLAVKKSSRGAAHGDLDGDGDSDIVVNEIDAEATLLENEGKPRGRWLAVRARGAMRPEAAPSPRGRPAAASNRDGIGAVVAVTAGGKTQRQRIHSGASYASQSELVARFGLAEAARVDALSILWPSGREERYAVEGVDRLVELHEGQGQAVTREAGDRKTEG